MPSRTARLLLAAALLALSAACAEGASARAMTLTPADLRGPPGPDVASAVAVGTVSGGKETNPAWKSTIDDASFREALVESLRVAGLLSERPDAPLQVSATIVNLDQPMLGFSLTVVSTVRYTVRETRTGAVVIDEQITADHTATVGDAFNGTKRLKLANEGSARKNLAKLVERLNAIRKGGPAARPST